MACFADTQRGIAAAQVRVEAWSLGLRPVPTPAELSPRRRWGDYGITIGAQHYVVIATVVW